MREWTPQYELEYWNGNPNESFYTEYIKKKYIYFSPEDKISKYIKCPLDKVMDIGGGRYGGSLYFYRGGKEQILFDYLANDFLQSKKLHQQIIPVQGTFTDIPYPDNSISVIFCWEALDHSLNEQEFFKGQDEITRILQPGGLLFFECPMRPAPQDGHAVTRNMNQLLFGFRKLQVIEKNSTNLVGCQTACLLMTKQ